MMPSEPSSGDIFNTSNFFNAPGGDDRFVELTDKIVVDRDYVAALMQDVDGVMVYLSGVDRYIFVRGADMADLVEKLK